MKKRNFLLDRFNKEGYRSIPDFINRSGVPLVFETLRYAIYEGKFKDINTDSLIKIMKHLNFTPNEIRDKLKELGEKTYSSLIGGQDIQLREWEKALLEIFNAFRKEGDYETWNAMIEGLKTYAKIFGVDIDTSAASLLMKRKE